MANEVYGEQGLFLWACQNTVNMSWEKKFLFLGGMGWIFSRAAKMNRTFRIHGANEVARPKLGDSRNLAFD